MSIKFCPYCAKPWSRTPFCAYCGKDLRAFIQVAESGTPVESPAAENAVMETDADIAALDAIFTEAAKTPYIAALEPFEVESHGNGKYAIVGLKLKMKNILFIEIPDCVEAIGDGAFRGRAAMEITLPTSVVRIGRRAFADCPDLEAVKGLGDHVRIIADEAFADCPNLEITLPEKARLGKDVIRGTLTERREAEEARLAEEARKAEEAKKAFEAVCDICDGVVIKYKGSGGNVVIPDGVTSIGDKAFSECKSLKSITIPDSVTSIGEDAFYECESLTSITIPDSVTSIGSAAFYECTGLTSITIPDSVTSIGKFTFALCKSLTNITIPDSVTSIGYKAFSNCNSLTSITIPDSVTSIGDWAFYGCNSLTSITIPRRFSHHISIDPSQTSVSYI